MADLQRSTLVNSEKYIGLDVHQATISVAVMDSAGTVVMESILETKAATILGPELAFRAETMRGLDKRTWRSFEVAGCFRLSDNKHE
jgi:hypothetical protein